VIAVTPEDRVRALVAALIGTEPAAVDLDTTWRALGVDSLDLLDLFVTCEQEFGVTIADEEAMNFRRARQIVDFLERVG
jgi:acyl carrier protein